MANRSLGRLNLDGDVDDDIVVAALVVVTLTGLEAEAVVCGDEDNLAVRPWLFCFNPAASVEAWLLLRLMFAPADEGGRSGMFIA